MSLSNSTTRPIRCIPRSRVPRSTSTRSRPGRPLARLRSVASRDRPVGTITRGTTNPNRLRRCDRWIAGPQALAPATQRHPARRRRPRLRRLPRHGGGAARPAAPRARRRAGRRHRDRPRPRARRRTPRARRPDLPARRLRGAARRRGATDGRARLQRAAPVCRGRGRGRLGAGAGAAGSRRHPRRRHVRRDRAARGVGDRRPRPARSASPCRCGSPDCSGPRTSPSGCRSRSSTATSPASRCTPSSPISTAPGSAARPARRGARGSASSPLLEQVRETWPLLDGPGPLAAGRGDGRLGRRGSARVTLERWRTTEHTGRSRPA